MQAIRLISTCKAIWGESIANVFIPLSIFTIALQPGIKIDFWRGLYHLIYTTCLPLWRCKIFFIVKQTRNKTNKTENLSMHNYSPPQSQYFVEPPFAAITAAHLLGYVSISLAHLATGIFAHSSRQTCSFKLDRFCWCTAILSHTTDSQLDWGLGFD